MPRAYLVLFLPALALLAPWPAARAQGDALAERGELLYSTYCSSCHRTEIHWRDQRLATDWKSLRDQVRRWQANIGLSWEPGDTAAITDYLNTRFYRFPVGDGARR